VADHEATALLSRWKDGNDKALEQLMPLVHAELHRLASGYMRNERKDHTLQATALIHEAYIRMIDQRDMDWQGSVHFIALAANTMRRILVDHARARAGAKRGGGVRNIPLENIHEVASTEDPNLIAVDEALMELAQQDPDLGRIVELRYFGGLNSEEIAEVMNISAPTVTRRMRMAKAWLHRYMTGTKGEERDER
jgi:RNA polymerase sigma factor (TIGR02999 family)